MASSLMNGTAGAHAASMADAVAGPGKGGQQSTPCTDRWLTTRGATWRCVVRVVRVALRRLTHTLERCERLDGPPQLRIRGSARRLAACPFGLFWRRVIAQSCQGLLDCLSDVRVGCKAAEGHPLRLEHHFR